MKIVLLFSIIVFAVLVIVCGCNRPETGENRNGKYSWERAARPGELKDSDLPGVYTCRFLNGLSTIQIKRDGTYWVLLRNKQGDCVRYGPRKWYSQRLDSTDPNIVFQEIPLKYATMHKSFSDGDMITPSRDWIGVSLIGFNKDGVLLLGIGVDPDNDYYFVRSAD
jgi:hypothetical protein